MAPLVAVPFVPAVWHYPHRQPQTQDEDDMNDDHKGVIFDWAGTVIDFGSFAPMGVFVKLFTEHGIEITVEEARQPMGMPKRDHIRAILNMSRIAAEWRTVHGKPASEDDADELYRVFVPMNEEVVADHADLVPGTAETVAFLRENGYRIGSTTGYTRSIIERVAPIAARQGFEPETIVCADDLPYGRPTPMGMYKCCLDLGIADTRQLIKVDDTEPGIAEGVAADCMTVGVLLSGNHGGLTVEEWKILDANVAAHIRQEVGAKLNAAGADYLIDTVADLPALLETL